MLFLAYDTADQRHRTSAAWLEKTMERGETIGIPWHCMMAFLRIATAPIGVKRPLAMADAASILGTWLQDPRFAIPAPGRRFWSILKAIAEDGGTRGAGWSDACLAALAMENGAALATFDRDFRKCKGLKLVEL